MRYWWWWCAGTDPGTPDCIQQVWFNMLHSAQLLVGHDLRAELTKLGLGECGMIGATELMLRLTDGIDDLMIAWIIVHALLLHLGQGLLQ